MPDTYPNFAALLANHTEGQDFTRLIRSRQNATVAVLAPHGGRIEPLTDTIAEEIAAKDFSLYCFRSRVPNAKANLHITSHKFDDKKCLEIVSKHRWALAVHGCNKKGIRVLLGGRDSALVMDLAVGLNKYEINAEVTGHEYAGTDPMNICNRTSTNQGVQFELSMQFRLSKMRSTFVQVVHQVLLSRQNAA